MVGSPICVLCFKLLTHFSCRMLNTLPVMQARVFKLDAFARVHALFHGSSIIESPTVAQSLL